MNCLVNNIMNFLQELKTKHMNVQVGVFSQYYDINIFISEIVKEVHFGNCEGSSYFSVPKELNDSKNGLINIQNEDNEWF